jgi:hypothetical protein
MSVYIGTLRPGRFQSVETVQGIPQLSHTSFCAPNVSQSEQTSIFISFTMEAPFQKVVFVLSWGRRQANEAKYIIENADPLELDPCDSLITRSQN